MKRQDYLAAEYGYTWRPKPAAAVKTALVFPNVYRLGMSNLGFQLIWKAAHEHPLGCAERVFLPELGDRPEPASLETGRNLRAFDLLAFSLSYEQDYLNALKMLSAAKIPLRTQDRGDEHPIVLAGGPALWGNPEPLAPFLDAVVVGEGEIAIGAVIDRLAACSSTAIVTEGRYGSRRSRIHEALAELTGLYVPALYDPEYGPGERFAGLSPSGRAPARISRLWVRDLAAHPATSVLLSPHTEFADTYLVEVARGCGRGCRFCMAGFMTRPVRYRTVPSLIAQIEQGLSLTKKIGLLAASVSDHPGLPELGTYLKRKAVRLYMSSIRADMVTPAMVELMRYGGLKGLTIAPEAGSEQMRDRLNKHLEAEQILRAVEVAASGGMQAIKFYFMVGLPGETQADVEAIVDLTAAAVARGRKLGISQWVVDLHPFVPKAFTPLQWAAPPPPKHTEQVLLQLRRALAKLGVRTRFDSPAWAQVQAVLATGDRRTANVIEAALAGGGSLGAYRRAIATSPVPREYSVSDPLPWGHLQEAVSPRFLRHELSRATRAVPSPPCPIAGPLDLEQNLACARCGVCTVRKPQAGVCLGNQAGG